MPVCDAIIVSAISRMLGTVAAAVIIILTKRLLLIMSTLVLRLKAAESFLETS